MEMLKKKLLVITLTLTTFLVVFAAVGPTAVATQYIDVNNYCWIEGASLDIGFSKYGEMIGYNETTGIGLGLQYPGYAGAGNTYNQRLETSADPFCNEDVDPDLWLNGWFIDIKYMIVTGGWQEIWAFAMSSDGSLHGGDWVTMPEVVWNDSARPLWQEFPPYANPDSDRYPAPKPAYGGRKTNGVCVTDPITIVYNGPGKFVAVCKTRISDGPRNLVDVYFTIIFNKANKNVIVLNDVQRLYNKKTLEIAFGNTGEWDLNFPDYVHFYTNDSYAVAQVIDKHANYVGAVAVWPCPEFWSVDNVYQYPYPGPSTIPLMFAPISRMSEWHRWTVDEDPVDIDYPHGQLLDRENIWIKVNDTQFYHEPTIPFIIYEHDFTLQIGVRDMWRSVSAYILTDYHDADDADAKIGGNNEPWSNGLNVIDTKVQYQLDEILTSLTHDIAITNVTPSKTVVGQGDSLSINATVENQGIYEETFNVTAYANNIPVALQTITLSSGNLKIVTFTWNTAGFAEGNYLIKAIADTVSGESDTADNTFVNGIVEVVVKKNVPIPGDGNAIIESNVTITNAIAGKNTLHFDASGPSGSTGWINVTFPMINTTDIKVFINGVKLTPPPFPIITTNGTHYFIYFEFTLSTHEITIEYAPPSPPTLVGGYSIAIEGYTPAQPLAPYLVVATIFVVGLATFKRKMQRQIK